MKQLFTMLMLFTISTLIAQEEAKKKKSFDLSASVDAYYRTNLTAPNDVNQISPGTSFADLSGFSLGMANIIASYEGEKVGFVADLVFGLRGEAASNTELNQIYVCLNVSETVTLTMGKFNTFLGYEVIASADNFNYSTSYLFSNGPFSHTGLKVDFQLSNDYSLMLGIMNQTDVTEFNPDGSYALGAQLGYADSVFVTYCTTIAGLGFVDRLYWRIQYFRSLLPWA